MRRSGDTLGQLRVHVTFSHDELVGCQFDGEAEVGPAEVGPAEVGPVEGGPAETGPFEMRVQEVGPF